MCVNLNQPLRKFISNFLLIWFQSQILLLYSIVFSLIVQNGTLICVLSHLDLETIIKCGVREVQKLTPQQGLHEEPI